MESAAYMGYTGIVPFSFFQQPISSITHFFGAIMFAWIAVQVWRRTDRLGPIRKASVFLFFFSVIFMFMMSGFYHMLTPIDVLDTASHKLDHIGIVLFIAAYFTVLHTLLYKGPWREWFLAAIWTICLVSIAIKTFYYGKMNGLWTMGFYMGLGSLGFITAAKMTLEKGFWFYRELVMGSVIVVVAAGMDRVMHGPVLVEGYLGPHEIFHVVALVAMLLHYRFIQRVILTSVRQDSTERRKKKRKKKHLRKSMLFF